MSDFYGRPAKRLVSEFITLDVLEHAGPRVVRLNFRGSPNLFAEIPDVVTHTTLGDYHYLGGHRLWHAPESMPRTYSPDDAGVALTEIDAGVILEGSTEPATGIQKSIEIHLNAAKPEVRLVHTLANHGPWPVELAPWMITQLLLGGVAIAPLPAGNGDPDGLLPNRNLSLWPYTRIHDPRLHMDDDFILFRASASLPPFKIGYFNQDGWLAYWNTGVLFRKKFNVVLDVLHPDRNCNAEIYCGDRFVELESLAPLTRIAPGESVQATEVWELYDQLDQPFLEAVSERVARLTEV